MTVSSQSPVKKQLHNAIQPSNGQYEYHDKLSTLGMRIRQAVDNGYQGVSVHNTANNTIAATSGSNGSNSSINGAGFSNICVQDNTRFTIPEYKRVALAKQPPMLVNQRTVSMNSNLEQWEQNLDQRLSSIDDDIMRNKLGASDFLSGASKRSFDDLEF
ncbi:Dif1p [Kluyveromyces lactis]|uniref:Damage-regulated import facilitator 1 n=1 Tax=Kluyveromyces lactis (strain ATCC 8585 / CBS 2359 / DSM 70799 / NBRC 1267 / NRRL Y-1140 / WM37) TaxID=284590 RepID=DIF1_KLULA|nr:uncharacterized protein KLLA0_B05423g [Kluyveromyces lactis]Q6CWB2.1 RecName: Full=Damage-regulated import facilitator 1 [Kluyveromyces lactis NRRL Y-1140]CAH02170.1 KLLA0B05423p [Kluyveromyces lactis]|eukprot:XP_451777.1 uncharacterized protein KLLA0_B05423g [Kluyveromyces lactis]